RGYVGAGLTVGVARAAFPNGSLAIRMRDALGEVFVDEEFAELFAVRGHPSTSPARLVMVSVLQFAEGLTDRQAAEAVRGRVDWKFLLGLPLEDPGFDASVLSEFRTRLTSEEGQVDRLLTLLLRHLREHRLLERGGRHRTDATHVHAAIRMLNRLELAMESMRAALETLAVAAPVWLVGHAPAVWWDRYAQRADDFRLPQSVTARTELAAAVGADGYRLLDAVHHRGAPAWLRELPALEILRQVWVSSTTATGAVTAGGTRATCRPARQRSAARTTPTPATASSAAWAGAASRVTSPRSASPTGRTSLSMSPRPQPP
ncbi:transposase, partial [Streptomyces violascens]|uniref:transposase n=1 Tax=Streptomyces violascens TaxID=67381 RepID=UPI00369EA227